MDRVKLAEDDKARYESEMASWDGGEAVAKPAPKPKTTKAKPVSPKPATPPQEDVDDDATQPIDDVDTEVEEDAFVDEPVKEAPKVEPKAAAKKSRKLPEFINDAKPTVKDAGFDIFAEEINEDALEVLGDKATKAAIKKHVLKEWTALDAEDRAWYAKNAGK
jgi:hypothetical protein